MACWLFGSINSMGRVHHILQFTCSRLFSHQTHKSNVYERILLQSRQVSRFIKGFLEYSNWINVPNLVFSLFSVGSLNGKFMFHDVVFICFDYSKRIQDGYFIFRWWHSYVPKDVSEDLSHSDTRLSVMLNGFELHCFNRSELYSKLETTFGLKPSMLIPVRK